MRSVGTSRTRCLGVLVIATGCLTGSPGVFGQAAPPTPAPTIPPPERDGAGPAPLSREAELEERVRQLEQMVRQLATQVNPGTGVPASTPGVIWPGPIAGPAGAAPAGGAAADVGPPGAVAAPSASGGASAPGQSLPPNPPPSARFQSPATLDNISAKVKFGPGFEIRSEDDEFILQFHNLTQFDYRGYLQGGQSPVHDTFTFPRQWFMFSGRVGKPLGYFVSLANAGFDTVNILDVFVDVDYDPRLRLRAGRFKTPFTYEFFVEPVQGLPITERSLFFNNFGQNRDEGLMAFGRILDSRVDYAVGIFNGNRNGFIDVNDAKAVSSFLNWRPFAGAEDSILENVNVGGSVFATRQANNIPTPTTFRTIVPLAGNAVAGVPFLTLNPNVREQGPTGLWDVHLAWFYRQLAVIAEWGSGYQSYAINNNLRNHFNIPVQSYYVEASYLLTGETRSSIGIVKPDRPFSLREGRRGPGAWEVALRHEYLNIGRDIFSNNLADSDLWTNQLHQTVVGLNWHLTQYVKIYFDWFHDEFGNPVRFTDFPVTRKQLTSDLFVLRLQVYF